MLKRLATLGLLMTGVAGAGLAFAATLNGFQIQSDPGTRQVQVTLNTDQKAPVTAEKSGNQLSIVLDRSQLSQSQLDQGLPVVLDNHNKFIGRAVPTSDGRVKIIIPNLPASEYNVSVKQQYPGGQSVTAVGGAPAAKAAPARQVASRIDLDDDAAAAPQQVAAPQAVKATPSASPLQPRPAVAGNPDNQFERIADQFPKPAPKAQVAPDNDGIRLNPTPVGANGMAAIAGGYPIWNPYVVPPNQQPFYNGVYSANTATKRPVKTAARHRDDVMNTMSVAESAPPQLSSVPALSGGSDPLAVLHSIPPFGTDQFAGIPDLSGNSNKPQTVIQSAPLFSLTELRTLAHHIPMWVYIVAGLFVGGIGLFALLGSLVLLKMLWQQSFGFSGRSAQSVSGWGAQQHVHIPNQVWSHAPIGVASPGFPMAPPPPQPEPLPANVSFEDTSAVNPFEYLKTTPTGVKEAVHNTILVKFPTDPKRRRTGSGTDGMSRPVRRRKRAL